MPGAVPRDGPSFEDVYLAMFDRVVRAVYVVIGNREDALDLTQDAFARVWAAWDRVRRMERPDAFVLRVAVNLSRSHARRHAVFGRLLPLLMGHGGPAPADAVETRLDILDALATLPHRQRWALVLCDLEGLTSEQASSVLRIRASTVRVHLARARAAMRQHLSETEPSQRAGPASAPG